MKNKKNNKKTVKPAYKVDITNCETASDVAISFAVAKYNAGIPLNEGDLSAIIDNELSKFADLLVEDGVLYYGEDGVIYPTPRVIKIECECYKKLPWYKRFWNWLRRK